MARKADSSPFWREEAAHWWTLLHGEGATAADRREFLSWVSRSPERIEAYLGMERLMTALRSPEVQWPDTPAEALIREARSSAEAPPAAAMFPDLRASGRVRAIPSESGGIRWKGLPRGFWVTAAAAGVAVVVVTLWLLVPIASQRYATALGEQRSILLADGSRVTLDSASSIDVELRKHRRIVHLLRGEALFQVSHDAARPFDVYAAGAVVRAIGTEFNVDIESSYAAVTVMQGQVAVMNGAQARLPVPTLQALQRFPVPAGALLLGVAERVIITPAGMASPQRVGDLSAVTAWTRGQLVFESRPLGEVIDDLNQHTAKRIVIQSTRLRRRKITGVIQFDDPRSLLSFLSDVPGVVIRESRDGTTIVTLNSRAADAGPPRGSSSDTP